ncbi:MAG: type I restriction-modification enzyme R subunit C-terminal domain-containing protein, partial [Bacteroidota bacterium]
QAQVQKFKDFLAAHREELEVLRIWYSQPARRKETTFRMIRELADALMRPPWGLDHEQLWGAYAQLHKDKVRNAGPQRMLTDILAILRFELGEDTELRPFSESLNLRFRDWVFRRNAGPSQFTEAQMEWLRMIKDHITTSLRIDRGAFDYSPFAEQGGLGKVWSLFGEELAGGVGRDERGVGGVMNA